MTNRASRAARTLLADEQSVRDFLAARTEVTPEGITSTADLWAAYSAFPGRRPHLYRDIFLRHVLHLAGTGDDVFQAVRRIGGRRVHVYTGIAVTPVTATC